MGITLKSTTALQFDSPSKSKFYNCHQSNIKNINNFKWLHRTEVAPVNFLKFALQRSTGKVHNDVLFILLKKMFCEAI